MFKRFTSTMIALDFIKAMEFGVRAWPLYI